MNNLNGRWSNGSFTLVIKRAKYLSYSGGLRYGKGEILFDNEYFILTSSHASRFFIFWIPFSEKVNGKFNVKGNNEIAVSNIEGRYSNLNGTWIRSYK